MKSWEIEKMLKEDIRDKKKTGSGAFHQRGKGVRHGFSGALRTPYHFMKNKEKKNLDGEVEVFNMYETVISYNEFKLKNIDLQKTMLERWRELYDNKKIMNEMGLTNANYYKLVGSLDIKKKQYDTEKRKETLKKAREAKAILAVQPKQEQITVELPEPEVHTPVVPEHVKLLTRGLYLEYNGSYDAEAISKIFTKLQLLVDGEPNKFKINICISEEA